MTGPHTAHGAVETYESELSAEAATRLMRLAQSKLFKERYEVPILGLRWNIDAYQLKNSGLTVAETPELSPEEARQVKKPAWFGLDVTGEARYQEISLAMTPYVSWEHPAPGH